MHDNVRRQDAELARKDCRRTIGVVRKANVLWRNKSEIIMRFSA